MAGPAANLAAAHGANVRRTARSLRENQLPLARNAQPVIAACVPDEHFARGTDELVAGNAPELAGRCRGGGMAVRRELNVVHGMLEGHVSTV